jgi:uncharacterized protein (TIGR03435 family)
MLPTAPPALGTCRYLKATLTTLMNVAFVGSRTDRLVSGGPSWSSSLEFDFQAKAENPSVTTTDQLRVMLQGFLRDRFKLQFHTETREVPGYALVVAKGGPKFHESSPMDHPVIASDLPNPHSTPPLDISNLLRFLSGIVKQPVIDQTGITGNPYFSLNNPEGSPTFNDPLGQSIFSAVQEQLGMRLESRKIKIEVFVIDSAEKPDENDAASL